MAAVGVLARFQIRKRWRSTVGIILLVGVVGAVVLATAAGARRSDTALDRFNDQARTADLEISIGVPTPKELAAFERTPGVVAIAQLRAYAFGETEGLPGLALAAPLDDNMNHTVDRSRLIAGRYADPASAEELTIGESLADQLHLDVGDHFETSTYTPAQVVTGFSGGDPGAPKGPTVRFQVVGVVRRPLDLGVRSTSGGVVILTPAFHRKYAGRIGLYTDVLRVRTTPGDATVRRVGAVARQMFGRDQTFGSQPLGVETQGACNAIDVLTLALWIIAGVTALAGLVAISIVLSREISQSDFDQETLRALGLTRRQRIELNAPRAVIIAIGAAVVAIIGGVLLSPLLPIGVARRADPNPGLHADWTVLLLAVVAIVVVTLGIALIAATRASRRSSFDRAQPAYRHTSRDRGARREHRAAAHRDDRAPDGRPVGRGRTAVPVRSAFVGAVFGVAGVTAVIVFAASLSHLVDTPRLYGWTFEVHGEVATNTVCADRDDHGVGEMPGVVAVAAACPKQMEINGRPVAVWGFLPLKGTVDPEVVSGRAPRGLREIALGADTLDALHKHIGDTVTVRGTRAKDDYRVVGRIVLPTIGESQTLADGASVTGAGFSALYRTGENETHALVAHLAPGTDPAAVERRFRTIPRVQNVGRVTVPVEVDRLEQVDRIPVAIAVMLGVLALLAVGHALVTAVRRRRGELALLKVLGFSRRQVGETVAWQATILGTVGLVLGIPLGIVVGRLTWNLVGNSLGVSPEVTTPLLGLALSVPVVLVLVNLIAFFPARSAGRTRPAVALREG